MATLSLAVMLKSGITSLSCIAVRRVSELLGRRDQFDDLLPLAIESFRRNSVLARENSCVCIPIPLVLDSVVLVSASQRT
jgi:hypothetical protein